MRNVQKMSNVIKKLPIVHPPFETYQGASFILGILLANSIIGDYFYNNYINIRCGNSKKMWDICLEFENSLWDSLNEEGIVELDLFHSSSLSKECFIS